MFYLSILILIYSPIMFSLYYLAYKLVKTFYYKQNTVKSDVKLGFIWVCLFMLEFIRITKTFVGIGIEEIDFSEADMLLYLISKSVNSQTILKNLFIESCIMLHFLSTTLNVKLVIKLWIF